MPARPAPRVISATTARRLAVARQQLSGPRIEAGSPDALLGVIRDLGCLQLDPISAVARSHLLVLWSRVGSFDRDDLDTLLWDERRLFEYWAHAASIVLTEDYPLHRRMMRRFLTGDTEWERRARGWMQENEALRRHVLRRLRREGPLRSRDLEDRSSRPWASSGWTAERNVDRMISFMWIQGQVMVAGRDGLQKVWDLSERCLPPGTPRRELPEGPAVRQAAQRSLRALGTGTAAHINKHFTANRYPRLGDALALLQRQGRIVPVAIDAGDGARWPGSWFVHAEDVAMLDRLEADGWESRTTLLSPFDNLIRDRARTVLMFGFEFRMEIYVPASKRRFGYYVLSILHGDRLIGRIDPTMDRRRGVLTVNAVHAEPGAPLDRGTGRDVRTAVEELAAFLGASEIVVTAGVPNGWKRSLRS